MNLLQRQAMSRSPLYYASASTDSIHANITSSTTGCTCKLGISKHGSSRCRLSWRSGTWWTSFLSRPQDRAMSDNTGRATFRRKYHKAMAVLSWKIRGCRWFSWLWCMRYMAKDKKTFMKKILTVKAFLRRKVFTTIVEECSDMPAHIDTIKALTEQRNEVAYR